MSKLINRFQMLSFLSNQCATWTEEEKINFIFDKLWDDYEKLTDHELYEKYVKLVEQRKNNNK